MLALTLEEVAAIVGGTVHDAAGRSATVVAPVMHDSRQVEPGGLFVALPGARVDGHDFVAAAMEAGAVGVLASRPVGVPAIVVDDVPAAYGRLARGVIDRLPNTTVIGVTGSVGKTSTKDMLGQVLGAFGPTVATRGSNNNELGLPYTVTLAGRDTRYLVLEMGARGIGHLAYLTEVAPVRIGVVTRVGTSHLGEFGSVEAIVQAKGELIEALPDDGIAILNANDPRVMSMASRTRARVISYGLDGSDVGAVGIGADDAGRPTFQLTHAGSRAGVRLRLYGAHQVSNALAAASVALGLGHPIEAVAEALSQAEALSPGRMQVTLRPDGVTVINDAYNASPEAMEAGLRALADMAAGTDRRAVAVLGEMAELGDHAPQVHRTVGERVAAAGVGWLVAVGGDGADQYAAGAAAGGAVVDRVSDVPAALNVLRAGLRPGDVVLVKAANSAGLQALAHQLTESGAVPA
ncbi:UDP-N-acetylmuramoyl-tripeptide--D-alanyl-D-alanine ligase [Micromonospora sp. NPDC050417]|uniref:UDP-N-acetylmuramoyl-tripeptide--D-alanyl-D- alanine ligase n=1 Tax=Micromonospora sp. NPDC050417 TaxID=3364280 RepID=UPI003787A339